MNLKNFIKMYSPQSHRGWSESMFECDFDLDDGFTLPEGFQIVSSISNIPHFIIATNRDERAIIIYQDGDLSLSIYDDVVYMDAAISIHTKFYHDRFNRFSLERFCQSVAKLDMMEVIDAISTELHTLENNYDNSKKMEIYLKDLKSILSLFFNTELQKDNLRDGFMRDAYPLLKKLEKYVVSVKNMNLVKIAEVYLSVTDETYYVLNKQYEDTITYISNTKENTITELINDGWNRFGCLLRWDMVPVDAFTKNKILIAVWDDGVVFKE